MKDQYQKDIDYQSEGEEYDEAKENREYYKQELGQEPTPEFVDRPKKRKREADDDDLAVAKKENKMNIDY